MRANVYVDGFNLYYGAIKDTKHKWLDLERFFTLLRPHDDVQTIYYFTALIRGSHAPSQVTYLRALETLPSIKIVLGKYKLKTIECGVLKCNFSGDRRFRIPEEKRTDVHIALQMVRDAWSNACDRLILVSGDSDLVPAVNVVKEVDPSKEVIVYVPARHPQRGAAVELRAAGDKDRILPNQLIKRAQFPPSVPDGAGGVIQRPPSW